MSNATFVLMNCDLVAVPLQLGAGVVTVYCGARRASELREAASHTARPNLAANPWPGGAARAPIRTRCIAPREAARGDRQ